MGPSATSGYLSKWVLHLERFPMTDLCDTGGVECREKGVSAWEHSSCPGDPWQGSSILYKPSTWLGTDIYDTLDPKTLICGYSLYYNRPACLVWGLHCPFVVRSTYPMWCEDTLELHLRHAQDGIWLSFGYWQHHRQQKSEALQVWAGWRRLGDHLRSHLGVEGECLSPPNSYARWPLVNRFTRTPHYSSHRIVPQPSLMSYLPCTASTLCSAVQEQWHSPLQSSMPLHLHANILTSTIQKQTCQMFIGLQWVHHSSFSLLLISFILACCTQFSILNSNSNTSRNMVGSRHGLR